jgi:hypothetical protein
LSFLTTRFESATSVSWVLLDTLYNIDSDLYQHHIFMTKLLDYRVDKGASWLTLASCLPFDSRLIYCTIIHKLEWVFPAFQYILTWGGRGRYLDYPMYNERCCDVAIFYPCCDLTNLQF